MVSLTLDNLGASYGRTRILDGISTGKLEGGCLTAVVGPNAAGKSTLFKRIAGLIRGDGTVTLEGTKRGRDGICYMPQDTGANAVLTVYDPSSWPRARMPAGGSARGIWLTSTGFSKASTSPILPSAISANCPVVSGNWWRLPRRSPAIRKCC